MCAKPSTLDGAQDHALHDVLGLQVPPLKNIFCVGAVGVDTRNMFRFDNLGEDLSAATLAAEQGADSFDKNGDGAVRREASLLMCELWKNRSDFYQRDPTNPANIGTRLHRKSTYGQQGNVISPTRHSLLMADNMINQDLLRLAGTNTERPTLPLQDVYDHDTQSLFNQIDQRLEQAGHFPTHIPV